MVRTLPLVSGQTVEVGRTDLRCRNEVEGREVDFPTFDSRFILVRISVEPR